MNKIRSVLKNLHKDNRGAAEMTTLVFMSWLIIMLALAGLDIFLMSSRFITVNNATQGALEMMKDEGGFSDEIGDWYEAELDRHNIMVGEGGHVQYKEYSPQHVQRGDEVHLDVVARYQITSFRPLGLSDEMLTLYWPIRKTGISRKFERPNL